MLDPYLENDRFDELFRAYHQAIWAYVRRRVSDDSVDDVVAETFIVAWRRGDQLPADPLPWLIGVARNHIRGSRRSEHRRARLLAKAQSHHVHRHDQIEIDDEHGAAAAALAQLSEQDREVLGLIAWDGLSPAQAAESLGIPGTRFRVRLHRARRRLLTAIETEATPEVGANDPSFHHHTTQATT